MKPSGGRDGDIELGGVGRAEVQGLVMGRDRAATAAKVSLPVQSKPLSRGLEVSTTTVLPARAMVILELLELEAAICTFGKLSLLAQISKISLCVCLLINEGSVQLVAMVESKAGLKGSLLWC